MSFSIALRYLLSTQRQAYLSLISWFSLLGMTLGVAALIVVTSVMNGFEVQLRERILSVVPHILVDGASQTELDAALSASSQSARFTGLVPYRATDAMINSEGDVAGIVVNGIRPESLAQVSRVPSAMRVGELTLLQPTQFNAVIGAGLARQLGVYVGDKISIILPKISTTPVGIFPRSRQFTVVGIFEVGADVDLSQVYVNYTDLARLLREPEDYSHYRLAVDDVLTAPAIASELRRQLPHAVVRDWSQSHGSLFQAVKVEKIMVALMLTVIIAVAAFNVVAVLTMMVINKRSAIAVLLTIGASRRLIIGVFVQQGLILGVVGACAGVAIGLPIALYLEPIMTAIETIMGFSLFDANVYYITHLPSDVRWPHVFYVFALALLMSAVATIYPAYKASAVQPSEVLRYE